MTFDSISFSLFFALLFLLFKLVGPKIKPLVILVGSYYFYSVLNPLFLPIILISTITDYFCAIGIEDKPKHRNIFVSISIILNLSLLFTFKYYGFFSEVIAQATGLIGYQIELPQFSFLFPIGISFYTFQTIGYTMDVWREEVPAQRSYISFSNFVCFFPQLIAGPLERASFLIPQLVTFRKPTDKELKWSMAIFLLGLFKKVVISDRLAVIIGQNTQNPQELLYSANNLITYYLMYFRLYYDFSGYSIMAIGIAGALGVRLSNNFDSPHFSTNISEFWRRWHITLHIWLKTYIFKPFLKRYPSRFITAILLVFLASGLWHGASWNFIIWGLFNAACVLIYQYFLKNRIANSKLASSKAFYLASILTTHFLMAQTSSFYFFKNFFDAIGFIKHGFYFSQFRLSEYLSTLSPSFFTDIKIAVCFTIILETFSYLIYTKRIDPKKVIEKYFFLVVGGFLIFIFLFAHEVSTDFRYYNF